MAYRNIGKLSGRGKRGVKKLIEREGQLEGMKFICDIGESRKYRVCD